jgi:hypothetical protein
MFIMHRSALRTVMHVFALVPRHSSVQINNDRVIK